MSKTFAYYQTSDNSGNKCHVSYLLLCGFGGCGDDERRRGNREQLREF